MRAPSLVILLLALAPPAAAAAQDAAALQLLLTRGDSLHDALRPAEALAAYRAALFIDSTSRDALWKAARSQVDVAKQMAARTDSARNARDWLYEQARRWAERAVAGDSGNADAWFAYALALGQASRTRGGKERVRFAREIYDACARGLALDDGHSGLHHILGAWHAEIERLSGLSRFFAKTFLGAGFMDRATWDSAVVHLERAVAIRPEYVFHRLELAQIYVDIERYADARQQLRAAADLPPTSDVMDPAYQADAARLLAEIAGKRP